MMEELLITAGVAGLGVACFLAGHGVGHRAGWTDCTNQMKDALSQRSQRASATRAHNRKMASIPAMVADERAQEARDQIALALDSGKRPAEILTELNAEAAAHDAR